jgi:putative Holliday junction resolvase
VTETLTLLGFDYGKKRIGVAVGQTLTGTATPLGTVAVNRGEPDWDRIAGIVQEWRPAALVVGLPLNMDGTSQSMTRESGRFARELGKRFGCPVYRADERLSSYEAKMRLKDTRGLDPVAAQAILETWLSEYRDRRPAGQDAEFQDT